jgi:glycosyltransferase involved in cell wall biosynthesis
MKMPKVSIITPTFDRPHFLNLVFECVVGQSYPNIEWLILDDGPSPNLDFKNKCKSNMKYIYSETKLSVGEKRNQLIEASSGDYIAHFDDDDFYNKDYIQTLMDYLALQKADLALLSGFYCFHLDRKILGYYKTHVKKGLGFKFSKTGIQALDLDKQHIPWIHLCFGWSYIFKKEVWENTPFQAINVFEDRTFVTNAIKNQFKISFYEDEKGYAFHSVHKKSSSVCFPQFILPSHLTKQIFTEQTDLAQKFIDAASS